MTASRFCLVLALVFALPLMGAQALEKRLAVLELLDEGAKLTPFELSALTDDVRAAALVLQPSGYLVMTRESMMAMLGPDGDATLKRCTGASCEVEAGRTLGADLVVAGTVGKFADELEVRIKLFDTQSASLLSQRSATGATLKGLRTALRQEASVLFGAVGGGLTPAATVATPTTTRVVAPPAGLATGPQKKTGAVTAATADLTIDAKPREVVRLTLTDPAGTTEVVGSPYKNPAAAPGAWRVKAEAAGYEGVDKVLTVPPDEATLEKIELRLLGGLSVTGTPPGAAVTVTGPNGWADDGGLPAEWSGLPSGAYQVSVARAGYTAFTQDVTVQAGQAAQVKVALEKEGAAAATGGPSTALGAGMVSIPAGEFWMGCNPTTDNECQDDEKPGRTVTLDAYRIDVHEVTVAQYGACVKAGRCSEKGLTMPYWSDKEQPDWAWACNWSKGGREQHPINCLDWSQAKAYCEWAGKRLPTEAEWEKAARGTDGRKYAWGNAGFGSVGKVANIADEAAKKQASGWTVAEGYDDGYYGTAPVGSYPAGKSPYGALDMIGNVWEWVADVYDSGAYGKLPARNPRSDAGSAWRVVRGGSWGVQPVAARASYRVNVAPSLRYGDIGVRCAQ